MRLPILLFPLACLLALSARAEIGFAIADDPEDGDLEIDYAYVVDENDSHQALGTKARDILIKRGHLKQNVFNHTSRVQGHDLSHGYLVVVYSRFRIDRDFYQAYGLGASLYSFEEAEKRAVENLSTYCWAWEKEKGYVVKEEVEF